MSRALVLVLVCGITVAACLPGGETSKDFSAFQTYQFEQTPGLGFCADPDQVFSAQIIREADGGMSFAHTVLDLVGTDPEACGDDIAAQPGC